ncbi:MAG: HAMP domain-containing protein [Kouleothrix sp.]|nr:HAMP domain-containing protein [Kouleothrix sp.]
MASATGSASQSRACGQGRETRRQGDKETRRQGDKARRQGDFSVQHSAFSIQRSAFSVQHSAFSVQHSAFSVQRSAFSVQRSAFSVQRSAFSVQRSAFSVYRKQAMFRSLRRARLPSRSALQELIMSRSLRWRLTAWYVLLLSGLLLVFSAGTYVAVYKLLLSSFDDVLSSQANLIIQTIDVSDPELTLKNAALRAGRRNDEHLTRLYRADGTLIFDDNPEERASELVDAVERALEEGKQERLLIRGREGELRVVTFPVTRDGKVAGALQVGLALEDLNDTMRTLLKVMLLLAPAMLLLASGGGLFLANRALSPIDRITRTAQRISGEDLSRRIALDGPDDEVGRLARTFDAMLARLQSAFEQQRRFAADASHELRTPLTAMIGQIDVAVERSRDAESYRGTLLAVREQAQRMARLSNDLLQLARSDAQPAAVAQEPIDLGDLLPAIVAQVEPLAQARGQTIVCEPAGPLWVRGSEDDLIRLFLNLLDNAIRYTPQGGTITVAGAAIADCKLQIADYSNPQSAIQVSVSDTGQGIAPEHLPHLFDRFFRVDRARSRAQGGSGLGLAIARSIVQAHGGQLLVASDVGRGSTFTAILPRAKG